MLVFLSFLWVEDTLAPAAEISEAVVVGGGTIWDGAWCSAGAIGVLVLVRVVEGGWCLCCFSSHHVIISISFTRYFTPRLRCAVASALTRSGCGDGCENGEKGSLLCGLVEWGERGRDASSPDGCI